MHCSLMIVAAIFLKPFFKLLFVTKQNLANLSPERDKKKYRIKKIDKIG